MQFSPFCWCHQRQDWHHVRKFKFDKLGRLAVWQSCSQTLSCCDYIHQNVWSSMLYYLVCVRIDQEPLLAIICRWMNSQVIPTLCLTRLCTQQNRYWTEFPQILPIQTPRKGSSFSCSFMFQWRFSHFLRDQHLLHIYFRPDLASVSLSVCGLHLYHYLTYFHLWKYQFWRDHQGSSRL